MKKIKLGERPLSLQDVFDVAVNGQAVTLSSSASKKIQKAHKYLQKKIKEGGTHYGINTGFGFLSNVQIKNDQIEALQYNILRSHATGVGSFIPDHYVRAMLLLRANTLIQGHSGVSEELVNQILELLNKNVCPLIPEQGSVGACGDLAPLAHLALVLIGEGQARVKGQVMSGGEALSSVGLKPIRLGPKEGLALINGTQFMTALGCLALFESEHLCDLADLVGATTVEALRGTFAAFDELIQKVRPHPGQIEVAKRLRSFLSPEGKKSQISKSHKNCKRIQDPYSLRCMPQVHGSVRDTLVYVRKILETEINAVTDNPLIFAAQDKILSGGNFHGEYVAMAMDYLAIAMAELANISEQRIEKLINPAFSELPPFLTKKSGLNSGLMIIQVAAASIVSENKTLCHPASVDSIPTSADKEDHVSMGAWAARKAVKVVCNTRRVISMEILSATQGIDLLRPLKSTPVIEKFHKQVRKQVPFIEEDRVFHFDLLRLENMIESYELQELASSG